MTYELKTKGYIINEKKTYRLMKENNMLKAKPVKSEKSFVKYRKVLPKNPLEVLEMDIKFV
jgi:putative transposase